MKDLAQKPPGAGGGSIATRGFLVQTLVALLDVVQANQNFSEITLEPAFGDEQFDFVWKDHAGTHATQVKSTTNSFTKAKAAKWAKKLEKARTTESCCLMLVGNIHHSLNGVKSVGAVCRDFMEMSPFGLNRNVPFGRCCCSSMGLNGDIEYEPERTEPFNCHGTSQT
jgi:hypothetical protein